LFTLYSAPLWVRESPVYILEKASSADLAYAVMLSNLLLYFF
jgi:hypothetical protein